MSHKVDPLDRELFGVPVRIILEEQRIEREALPILRKLVNPYLNQAERRRAFKRAQVRARLEVPDGG